MGGKQLLAAIFLLLLIQRIDLGFRLNFMTTKTIQHNNNKTHGQLCHLLNICVTCVMYRVKQCKQTNNRLSLRLNDQWL